MPTISHDTFLANVEPYRRELKAHCYRMSGSLHDAEDLVQDSLIKAWQRFDQFEGRSSLRRWLYTVATHTCLDALDAKKSRVLLSGPAADPTRPPPGPDEGPWLDPYPDSELPAPEAPSAEARYTQRESVTLAFLSALQLLPARQRAVLLLRDVLGWQAAECAELLETTVAAVNSALQRARETLANEPRPAPSSDASLKALLEKYVRAWESSDLKALVALLQKDALAAMPPLPVWFSGAEAVGAFFGRFVMPRGRFELTPISANGQPALLCRVDGQPAGLHVLTVRDGQIARIDAFLQPEVIARFVPA